MIDSFEIGELKRCTKCEAIQDTTCFTRRTSGKDSLNSWCKICVLENRRACKTKHMADKKLREKYRERWNAYNLKARQGDRVAARIKRRKTLTRAMYGIEYSVVEEMIKAQNFQCEICLSEISLGHRGYAIDHNHNTGMVRGLLCTLCNSGIGKLKENETVLLSAIKYLRKYNSH